MKLKNIFSLIIGLNLSCAHIIGADTPSDRVSSASISISSSVGYLNADTLNAAYQDFLAFYRTSEEMKTSGIQPAILFAQELRQRGEDALSWQMLNTTGAIDISNLSAIDLEKIQDTLRWIPLEHIAPLAVDKNPSPYQKWLQDTVYSVFPKNEDLFSLSLLAESKDLTIRKQAAQNLFNLMKTTTDLSAKQYAAAQLIGIRDYNRQSFLKTDEFDQVAETLFSAILDSTPKKDLAFFADALMCGFNAASDGRICTDAQRQTVLDKLLVLAGKKEYEPHYQNFFVHIVLNHGIYKESKRDFVYLAPEAQRREALQIILTNLRAGSYFFGVGDMRTVFWTVENNFEKKDDAADPYLASKEERAEIAALVLKRMKHARDWEKAMLLMTQDEPSDEKKSLYLDVIKSPYASAEEKVQAMKYMQCFRSVEEETMVYRIFLNLLTIPKLNTWSKQEIIRKILNVRNDKVISQEQIKIAVEEAIRIIKDTTIYLTYKHSLAQDLIEAKDLDFTKEQLQILIPQILTTLGSTHTQEYYKENLAKWLLNHKLTTDDHRREALKVIINFMNSDKELADRKNHARTVVDAKNVAGAAPLATAEQIAAAQAILAL